MHSVTSNAVVEVIENAISVTAVEKESGMYFDNTRYHRAFVFNNINLVANTSYVLSNAFEIPRNKTVGLNAFVINNDVWSNDIKVYILSNGTLAVQSTLGGNNFSVVIDVYYIK